MNLRDKSLNSNTSLVKKFIKLVINFSELKYQFS